MRAKPAARHVWQLDLSITGPFPEKQLAPGRSSLILRVVNTLLSVVARCEHKNVEPSTAAAPTQAMWASIRIDAVGAGLERERAPLAIVLVVDVSGSMHGSPLEHAL
jgi:Mg-chelatase subunit ChlD